MSSHFLQLKPGFHRESKAKKSFFLCEKENLSVKINTFIIALMTYE